MQKYKLLIAYDGTEFEGWQAQPHRVTIQDRLQDTFEHVFGHAVSVIGSSRTDAGVHALGQVAQICTNVSIDPARMRVAWQQTLGSSIVVRDIIRVEQAFYPLRDVRAKEYWYHLFLRQPLPGFARYGWWYEHINQVDFTCFEDVLSLFVGTHDFGSFCKNEEARSAVRTIFSLRVSRLHHMGALRIQIVGSGFLRFQIRRMIGCALDVARRSSLTRMHVQAMLAQPNPQQSLMKAPAQGLCLRRVIYEK